VLIISPDRRELGVPTVVGCGDATRILNSGDVVTVSCAEGEIGRIYPRRLNFEIEQTDLSDLKHPATSIMLNLGNPEIVFKTRR